MKYKYSKTVPKFIVPALDFVNGAQIALDTLPLEDAQVEATIYDTRSTLMDLNWLIKNKKLDELDLMIGAVKDLDFKLLAEFAEKKDVPFISATYPNDGGVTKNPYLVIMNSTLKAHCEGIYGYLVQNYGTNKILLCRKRGSQEDKIAAYFRESNDQDGKPLLNIQTLYFDSVITPGLLRNRIDTSKQTIIIGGSLDEVFARNLANASFSLSKNYDINLIGMPNWDGFKSFIKKDAYKDFPIHFTSPYYNNKMDRFSIMLNNEYTKRFRGRASDMVFKGFEAVYMFTRLLIKYDDKLLENMNDRNFKVFNEYNFKPVSTKKNSDKTDYFENKHLYILKLVNGSLARAW